MTFRRPSVAVMLASFFPYLLFYSFFTGAIKHTNYPNYFFKELRIVPVYYNSETYTGPGIQIFLGTGFTEIRLIPFLLGVFISFLLGLNIAYLWKLYRSGGAKACLTGSAGGGFAAFIASIATFSYVCCGWAPSMLLMGVSAVASLTMAFTVIPTAIASAVLVFNAYILSRRLDIIDRQRELMIKAHQS